MTVLELLAHADARRLRESLFGALMIGPLDCRNQDTLDQAVKQVVLATRPSGTVIPGLFALRFRINTGAVFGLFRAFPLGVTLLGIALFTGILVYLVRAAPVATRLERVALSMLPGGRGAT